MAEENVETPAEADRRRRRATWIAAAAIALLLAAALAVYFVNNRTAAVEAPPSGPPPIIAVSAEELAAGYDRDPIEADRIYDGRILNVTGRLSARSAGPAGDPVIVLAGADPLLDVTASFDKQDAALLGAIPQGSLVTVSCRRITFELDTPALFDCTVTSAVSAADPAAPEGNAAAANSAAANGTAANAASGR
ncbi:MAG: OB-fold putative lipoprotein [Pseudomonadota bacterium]|nr:OB-fold putative lipoprotein [Pseudomonadota bacterium]